MPDINYHVANKTNEDGYNVAVDAVLTNLVTNGNFSNGTTGWTGIGAVVNGVAEKISTAQYQNISNSLVNPVLYANHKLFMTALVKTDSAHVGMTITTTSPTYQSTVYHVGDNSFRRLYTVIVVDSACTAIYARIQDNRTIGWTKFYADDVMMYDLGDSSSPLYNLSIGELEYLVSLIPNQYHDGTYRIPTSSLLSLIRKNKLEINERTSYGVVSGLVVSQQTVSDMTVKVSTGTIYMADGTRYAPAAVAVQAVTAADATNPRIDIIYVNSSGVISYLAGTAGATPAAPEVPTGGMLLAEISIAANATTVVMANIAMRQKKLWIEDWITPTLLNAWVNFDSNRSNCQYTKDSLGFVHLKGNVKSGSLGMATFTLPSGYRPALQMIFATASNIAFGQANILSSGNVIITTGSPASFSLDGISFRAEA